MASVVKCLPKSWRKHTYTKYFLSFNCQQKRDIDIKLKSKAVYKNIVQKIIFTASSENFFKSNSNTNIEDFEPTYRLQYSILQYNNLHQIESIPIQNQSQYSVHKRKITQSY